MLFADDSRRGLPAAASGRAAGGTEHGRPCDAGGILHNVRDRPAAARPIRRDHPDRVRGIVETLVAGLDVPVTAKIRVFPDVRDAKCPDGHCNEGTATECLGYPLSAC